MFQAISTIVGAFALASKAVKSLFSRPKPTTTTTQRMQNLEEVLGIQTEEEKYKAIIPDGWVSMVSSYVKAVQYDLSSRELAVNYKGTICIYSAIPPDLYIQFLDHKGSKGIWARTHLFPKPYRYG